ncbi:PepSY domain-containing protein [Lutibaculum baratangense]|uniref:PepSY domain-containing protein n=1 Tax=Lutibaculum baratangense AMV1 TaxID=631454 RepID=V4RIY3_9HYPH|nr:PepSY domain-containing protein [Lutibaculum baratangense]ESR26046.1 hypothetical protein N177_1381 [Lutibaculum baratangense AMV1]
MNTRTLVIGVVAAAFATAPALADRDPTPEERTAVEDALRGHGFTSWDDIEFDDDGYWEVDDAVGADGKEYDLHLAPETFEILKQEED